MFYRKKPSVLFGCPKSTMLALCVDFRLGAPVFNSRYVLVSSLFIARVFCCGYRAVCFESRLRLYDCDLSNISAVTTVLSSPCAARVFCCGYRDMCFGSRLRLYGCLCLICRRLFRSISLVYSHAFPVVTGLCPYEATFAYMATFKSVYRHLGREA